MARTTHGDQGTPRVPPWYGIPPIVKEMIGVGLESVQNITSRISNVKLAPYEAGQKFERITFNFDGRPHVADLKGRNRDLVVGVSPEANAKIACRAMLDGDAKPTAPAAAGGTLPG